MSNDRLKSPEDFVSEKIKNIPPSGIRKFFDVVHEMDDAMSLGVGEPDFVTPWHIRSAAVKALENGHTYYSSNWGLLELREAISETVERKYDLKYNPKSEIIVTVGGSEAIDMAVRALIVPGDEVLITEPCFVCYTPCVTLAGGTPVSVVTKAENNFKLKKEDLLGKITDKTKLLIMSFPNNPTGAIMTREDLEEIASVIREKDIMVISDEIYAELTYGCKHFSIAQLPGMRDKTIVVSGFSKAYAMTGWRLGYIMGNEGIITEMIKIHQYCIMCSPTISQYAAIEALKNGDEDIEYMRKEYDMRRRFLVDSLNKMGLSCFEPQGAFYAFPSIKETGMASEQFCDKLLKAEKLAVVPGNAFGKSGEGFIRISYAYSLDDIRKAMEKIKHFLSGENYEY